MKRLDPTPSPWISLVDRSTDCYEGLRVMADARLHQQLEGFIRILAAGRSMAVLDWGCGEGALSQRLHNAGHRVLSVDREAKAFRAQGPEFHALNFNEPDQVDAFVAQFAGRFDLIAGVETIEHVEDPWRYARTLARLARPGTDIIVTTPNISSSLGRINFLLFGEHYGFSRANWREIGHINPLTELELRGILAETGLEVVDVYLAGELPIIWLATWKKALASLLGLILRPLMRGTRDGFALCFHVRQPARESSTSIEGAS